MIAAAADGVDVPLKRVTISQGEMRVASDPSIVLTAVLGSCIAACLYDPHVRVGGMNHFLLAEPGDNQPDPASMQRYGVYAMEVLINAMLARGATRGALRAKLYGGAMMNATMRDIGGGNSRFARDFLRQEGIALSAEDVGGHSARRVEFRAGLGLARCRTAAERPIPVMPSEAMPRMTGPAGAGNVEFF